jgi:hypothetical protein
MTKIPNSTWLISTGYIRTELVLKASPELVKGSSSQTKCFLVIGDWNLRFICILVLVVWNFFVGLNALDNKLYSWIYLI